MATADDDDLREVGAGSRGYRPLNDSTSTDSTIRVSPEIEMDQHSAPSRNSTQIGPELNNKPDGKPYYQQTMKSWSPLLTPNRAALGYLLIGLIFVPLGAVLWNDRDVIEFK